MKVILSSCQWRVISSLVEELIRWQVDNVDKLTRWAAPVNFINFIPIPQNQPANFINLSTILMGYIKHRDKLLLCALLILSINFLPPTATAQASRQKISINKGWRFIKGDPLDASGLSYDIRPEVTDRNDNVVADTKPTESIAIASSEKVLKNFQPLSQLGVLPASNPPLHRWRRK